MQGPNTVPFELHSQISRSFICPPLALLTMSLDITTELGFSGPPSAG